MREWERDLQCNKTKNIYLKISHHELGYFRCCPFKIFKDYIQHPNPNCNRDAECLVTIPGIDYGQLLGCLGFPLARLSSHSVLPCWFWVQCDSDTKQRLTIIIKTLQFWQPGTRPDSRKYLGKPEVIWNQSLNHCETSDSRTQSQSHESTPWSNLIRVAHNKSTIGVTMRTSRGWSSLDISLFAMLTVVGRFLVVDCQFVTEGDDLKTLCRPGQECRLISRCPAVLKLVLKVWGSSKPSFVNEFYDVTANILFDKAGPTQRLFYRSFPAMPSTNWLTETVSIAGEVWRFGCSREAAQVHLWVWEVPAEGLLWWDWDHRDHGQTQDIPELQHCPHQN